MKQEDWRAGSSRRTKKEADSQDLLSFQSCRSSAVDHVEEISLESSRKSQNVQVVMSETAGKARREEEKMRGDWNQKGTLRRWKPKLFRTGWEASTWTLMVKVAMKGCK